MVDAIKEIGSDSLPSEASYATSEDEAADQLWRSYWRRRTPALREQLIVRYLPYVRRIVRKLSMGAPGIFDADDATSYGVIGLMEAIERFEPGRGIKFEAYAAARVRGAVMDQLRSPNWRRTAPTAGGHLASTAPAVSSDVVSAARRTTGSAILSLDDATIVTKGDETLALVDMVVDEQSLDPAAEAEREDAVRALTEALGELPERDRLIVTLYHYEELSLRDIGELLGLSRARICQIHHRALAHLRARMRETAPSYWPAAWGAL
jgi:RNA polymerase sigma factor for flagellar operon FliA